MTEISHETSIKLLLSRAAKRRRRPSERYSQTLVGRDPDPNREFSRLENDPAGIWFFGTLSVFMIIYAIYVRLGAAY
jgi:hypothetical protein